MDQNVTRAKFLVANFFSFDEEKASMWFRSPNILLGGMSPNEMIKVGKTEKLLKFIINSLEENKMKMPG